MGTYSPHVLWIYICYEYIFIYIHSPVSKVALEKCAVEGWLGGLGNSGKAAGRRWPLYFSREHCVMGSNPSMLSLVPTPHLPTPTPQPWLVSVHSVCHGGWKRECWLCSTQLGSDSLLRSPYERPQSQASMFSENTKPEGDTWSLAEDSKPDRLLSLPKAQPALGQGKHLDERESAFSWEARGSNQNGLALKAETASLATCPPWTNCDEQREGSRMNKNLLVVYPD